MPWRWDILIHFPWYQGSCGQHGAHLWSTGPRWAPSWPHELCYLGWWWCKLHTYCHSELTCVCYPKEESGPLLRVPGLVPPCSWYGGLRHWTSIVSRTYRTCDPYSGHWRFQYRHQWPRAPRGEKPSFLWGHWSSPWSPATKPYQHACHGLPWCDGIGNALWWRRNGRDSVSNHQPHDCLLNRLFRRRWKKTSKLRVTGLFAGNSPGPLKSPHKGSVTQKMFPFDDVIMTSRVAHVSFLKSDCNWHFVRVRFTPDNNGYHTI